MFVSDISQERKKPLISGCCKRLKEDLQGTWKKMYLHEQINMS
jgi:hypothetical protein